MNFVTLDSVVADALSIIGLSGDDELAKNFARSWAWRACIDFPITNDSLKVTKVYPKNLILKKPNDFRRGVDIALYDTADCLIPHVMHSGRERIYPNTEQYAFTSEVNGEEVTRYIPVDLSESKDAYYLGTTGSDVAYAKIRYYAYPIGTDGYPMIPEEAVQTCMYYIRFNWSLRKNENQSEIANNERLYKIEADRCRARMKSFEMSGETRKTIGALFSRMLPNFNRSRH
jgi:hypothetical protein